MPRIELLLAVSAPPSRCFDLARSIELHVESATGTGERPVMGRTSGLMRLDESVTWSARHLGVRQELTSRITAFVPPHHFRDSMVRGAFTRFDHDHFFEAEGSGTRMRDVFDYDAPFGMLGDIVERVLLTAYMRRFLAERMAVIKRVAESDAWPRYLGSAG